MKKYTNEELLQQIRRYVQDFGKNPTSYLGKLHPIWLCRHRTFKKRFGSWNNAIKLAGFTPSRDNAGITSCHCTYCGKLIIRKKSSLHHRTNKSHNVFCNRTCAITYNNQQRVYKNPGVR